MFSVDSTKADGIRRQNNHGEDASYVSNIGFQGWLVNYGAKTTSEFSEGYRICMIILVKTCLPVSAANCTKLVYKTRAGVVIMSAGIDSPNLNRLSDLIKRLGAISNYDTQLGKRRHPRVKLVLPVRLQLLDELGNTQGPAFVARSRDISEQGLGLTVPSKLDEHKHFKVEMFSIIGSLTGRMETRHCTQTDGGYQIGLFWIESLKGGNQPQQHPRSNFALSMPPGKPRSDILTFDQALEEIRQAMRKYYVASISKGLLGLSMEQEICRVIESFPKPNVDKEAEPRRSSFRHEVEGQVHLMLSTPLGHEFSSNDIADLSKGGARVVIVPPRTLETLGKAPEVLPWPTGTTVTLGLWTQSGTLWLPARVTHCDQRSPELILAGLQFTLDKVMKDFA